MRCSIDSQAERIITFLACVGDDRPIDNGISPSASFRSKLPWIFRKNLLLPPRAAGSAELVTTTIEYRTEFLLM